jgi:hypothetical protein
MMVARETVSADSLTYTFTLRSGLKFHDGSPVRRDGIRLAGPVARRHHGRRGAEGPHRLGFGGR